MMIYAFLWAMLLIEGKGELAGGARGAADESEIAEAMFYIELETGKSKIFYDLWKFISLEN